MPGGGRGPINGGMPGPIAPGPCGIIMGLGVTPAGPPMPAMSMGGGNIIAARVGTKTRGARSEGDGGDGHAGGARDQRLSSGSCQHGQAPKELASAPHGGIRLLARNHAEGGGGHLPPAAAGRGPTMPA